MRFKHVYEGNVYMSKRLKTYLGILAVSVIGFPLMYLVNVPNGVYIAVGFVILFNIIQFEQKNGY